MNVTGEGMIVDVESARYGGGNATTTDFIRLAGEVSGDGIKVSTVVPGSILTPFGGRSVAEKRAAMADDPEKRYLEPEDVAAAILFLLRQPRHAWTQELNLWPF